MGKTLVPKSSLPAQPWRSWLTGAPIGVLPGPHSPNDLHVGEGAPQGLASPGWRTSVPWKILNNTTYLKDIAGSVPDHHKKSMNSEIKQVTQMFQFPNAYKSYVYTVLQSIKCAIALCLKKMDIP